MKAKICSCFCEPSPYLMEKGCNELNYVDCSHLNHFQVGLAECVNFSCRHVYRVMCKCKGKNHSFLTSCFESNCEDCMSGGGGDNPWYPWDPCDPPRI